MHDDRWEKENERECSCCIKVEDNIVIQLCGDLEFGILRNYIQSALQFNQCLPHSAPVFLAEDTIIHPFMNKFPDLPIRRKLFNTIIY